MCSTVVMNHKLQRIVDLTYCHFVGYACLCEVYLQLARNCVQISVTSLHGGKVGRVRTPLLYGVAYKHEPMIPIKEQFCS